MPRGKKRDANAIQVTVRPNTEGTKKSKTTVTKGGYTSRKKYYAKVNGQSKTRTVNLQYSTILSTPYTRNTVSSQVTTGNDITTLQPMGRDQMFALYDKVYVKSAVQEAYVSVPIASLAAGSFKTGTFIVNHWVDGNSSASASLAESTQRCLSHDGNHFVRIMEAIEGGNGSSIGTQAYLNGVPIHSKISGGTKSITHRGFDDPDLAHNSAGAPVTSWYFHLEMYPNDAAGTQSYTDCDVEKLTNFECVFFDPKELAVS